MNYIFKFKDIDDDKCKIEVDTLVLSVKITGENRKMSYYTANSKNKLFKILRNNIGNMPRNTYRDYIKFIEKI